MKGMTPMGLPYCLSDSTLPLVFDASAIINLNATGCAEQIVHAVPNPIFFVDEVAIEIERGRSKGRSDVELIRYLERSKRGSRVSLTPECDEVFISLVAGSPLSTLDDGEAATIAWAISAGAIPIIDERKGISICQQRFPELPLATTLELLRHDALQSQFSKSSLADAVFNALVGARMRVQHEHLNWVVALIGQDRADLCMSLPRSHRR
jgi:predicted nucleic acid-binding protein